MKTEVIKAERRHCDELLETMSEGDRIDMLRGWGIPMEEALLVNFHASRERWTILRDGHVIGMFGCTPEGNIWLMRSADFEAVAIRFIRQSGPYIDAMLARCGEVRGFASTEHGRLIRWLAWAGFEIEDLGNGYFQCTKRR